VGSVKRFFLQQWMDIGRSKSSKVTDFGTNRKCVCDFLLVLHSNLGPILHRFRDIAGFCACASPLLRPNLGMFPFDQMIFQVFQPLWKHSLPERHRQTDGRTTYCGI